MCFSKPSIASAVSLPLPSDGTAQYSKSEAAGIIQEYSVKGSRHRAQLMNRMIEMRLAPTSVRSLLRLVRMKEAGEHINNTPWNRWESAKKEAQLSSARISDCCGIQSKVLDEVSPENFKYCYGKNWYMGPSMKWFSIGCHGGDTDKNGRCKKCRNAYKNINRKRHPVLFESPIESASETAITNILPSSLPSHQKIAVLVSNRLETIVEEDIPKDPVLIESAKLLSISECDGIEVGKSQMFMVCNNCREHRVVQKRKNNSRLCAACKNKRSCQDRQKERREANWDQRTSPQSTTKLTVLTPQELKVRGAALMMQRRSKAATINQMKKKISSYKIDAKLDEELLNHMKDALDYAQNNEEKLNISIESSLIELLKEEAVKIGHSSEDALLSHKDTKHLVTYIADSMKNHIHKVDGHTNRYRFSPYLMGFAMNQYLQDGTSKYDQMRDDNVVVMPTSGNLAKKKSAQKLCVGDCIIMYEKQLLLHEWVEEMGQLMCDEMKLQEDVLINVKSNKMVGFTEDFICKKKILKNLMDDAKVDNFCEPAKYVNQWRYRSVNGRTFNCEFWFNGGSLDGDGMIEQFTQVVVHCEIIGSRVLGFVCDAGGANARLMKLLRGMENLPEGGWLPEEMVRTRNPFDPNRYIYLFHCSTHDLKAMRNQLFTSWRLGGKKQFLDANEVRIGKAIVEECFERDRQRELRNHAPLSEVRETTVILNKWSKMNVEEAKRPFSWKTLAEVATHLYNELGVIQKDHLSKEKNGPLGYMPAVAKHLKEILRRKAPSNAELLAPKISSFEWLANVHEIFNATLMNTKMLITWYNIDSYEKQIIQCLDYFDEMRQKQLQRRDTKNKDWKLSFMSPQTWTNLRITCRGFFGYCRNLMMYADQAAPGRIRKFSAILPAHSNSSSIEAWFSCVRQSKQDSATSYTAWVGSRDMFKASQALKNNKMYSADDVGEMSVGRNIGPSQFIKYHSKREGRIAEMVNQYRGSFTHTVDQEVPAFSIHVRTMIPSTLNEYEKAPLAELAEKKLPKGFCAELIEIEKFRQWMRLSLDTREESWFRYLVEDTVESGCKEQFEKACQIFLDKIFLMTIKSLQGRKGDEVSFETDLLDFHRSPEFAGLCWTLLPGRLAEMHSGCVILFLALSRLHSVWLKDALTNARRRRNPELFWLKTKSSLTGVEENNEVNRFMGWAVFSSMSKFSDDSARSNERKSLLSNMMIREREIDDEYMEKYYDWNMSLLNRGGLTLVNKNFFPWAKQLLSTVRRAFDEGKINQDPQHAFEKGKKEVLSDKKLKSYFLALCKRHAPAQVNSAETVFDVIVPKVIHSRFAVVFRSWKEANFKKNGQLALRLKLKAQNGKRSGSFADEKKQGKRSKITAHQGTGLVKSSASKKSDSKESTTAKLSDKESPNKAVSKKTRKRKATPFSSYPKENRNRRRVYIQSAKIFPRVYKSIMNGGGLTVGLPVDFPFTLM